MKQEKKHHHAKGNAVANDQHDLPLPTISASAPDGERTNLEALHAVPHQAQSDALQQCLDTDLLLCALTGETAIEQAALRPRIEHLLSLYGSLNALMGLDRFVLQDMGIAGQRATQLEALFAVARRLTQPAQLPRRCYSSQ